MYLLRKALVFLFCTSLLAACGGGGSGSASSPNSGGNPEGDWLTFEPAKLDITFYEGRSLPVYVNVSASKKFAKPFNIGITDSVGIITTDVSIESRSTISYGVTLNTNPALKSGVYTSNIQIRLCEDDPRVCKVPLPGSPWVFPIKATVKSNAEVTVNLTPDPAPLEITTYPGEAVPFSITAESQLDTGNAFKIGIVDPANISRVTKTYSLSSTTSVSKLETNPDLKVGEYSSVLEVRTCADDPVICRIPSAGSLHQIPLKIKVLNKSNLTPLSRIPQLGAWSAYRGNAAHNSYVAASFDPKNFSRRWSWNPAEYSNFSDFRIDNGLIFFNAYKNTHYLIALKEVDGQIQWRNELSQREAVYVPATGSGKIFLTARSFFSYNSDFLTYDQSSGALLNRVVIPRDPRPEYGSTVFGNEVFDGFSGHIVNKLIVGEQSPAWTVNLPESNTYTPAVDADHAYTFIAGVFYAVRKTDGSIAYSIDVRTSPDTFGLEGEIPVLSDKNIAFVGGNGLYAFDLSNRKLMWSGKGLYPAYANNVVYAFNEYGKRLDALSAQDGKLLWSFSVANDPSSIWKSFRNMIVTENLIFISSVDTLSGGTEGKTLAIDLATHKVVFSHSFGGSMAISDRGVLYIRDKNRIDAINLK